MAYMYSANFLNGSDSGSSAASSFMFEFKRFLKSAGWRCVGSGTGTGFTFSNSTDIITQSGTGAGGTDNTAAYYILTAPTGVRQIVVQRNNSTTVAMYWSFAGGFVATGASAYTSPADVKTVLNNVSTPAVGHRVQFMADPISPYGWYCFWYAQNATAMTGLIAMDPLIPGTYPSSDTDPYVWVYGTGGTIMVSPTNGTQNGSTGCYTNFYKGTANETSVAVAPILMDAGTNAAASLMFPQGVGKDFAGGKEQLVPVIWGKQNQGATVSNAFITGIKGASSLFRLSGIPRGAAATLSVNSSQDVIFVSAGMVGPWGGTTPLIC